MKQLKHPDIYEVPNDLSRYKGIHSYLCVDSLSRCYRCQQPAVWNAVTKDLDEWGMFCDEHFQSSCHTEPRNYPRTPLRLVAWSEFEWVEEETFAS